MEKNFYVDRNSLSEKYVRQYLPVKLIGAAAF
jgi:hypothetical protein